MIIRKFENTDWQDVWHILEPVFREGETYAFAPDISAQDAFNAWIELPSATFVALDQSGKLVGTYYIKPNQPALGAHVCNCGYIVAAQARGSGIASGMCEHSQHQAISMGFKAMQYNLVVSSNKTAIKLWQKHGFEVVGTLTKTFRHSKLGFIDALVMYKLLC